MYIPEQISQKDAKEQPKMNGITLWQHPWHWKLYVIKAPKQLHEKLMTTYYEERRYKGRGRFFDSSRLLVGRQSIQNRLPHIAQINDSWNELGKKKSNDEIRILLKKTFFKYLAEIAPTDIV